MRNAAQLTSSTFGTLKRLPAQLSANNGVPAVRDSTFLRGASLGLQFSHVINGTRSRCAPHHPSSVVAAMRARTRSAFSILGAAEGGQRALERRVRRRPKFRGPRVVAIVTDQHANVRCAATALRFLSVPPAKFTPGVRAQAAGP